MKQWNLKVSFATPAFLGDAKQKGAWRTPPFKALLRHWWRVAAARECHYDVRELRRRELALFGAASDDEKQKLGKSKVRLRLGEWREGRFSGKMSDRKVKHPEVKFPVGASLYLGYGPIGYRKGQGTVVNMEHAIASGEKNRLQIRGPESLAASVQLAAWFGTLGSRSRNGWGSLMAEGEGIDPVGRLLAGEADLRDCCRPLEQCLRLDWPHAIGCDNSGALVWKSRQGFGKWEDAMKHLAEVKIAFRTAIDISDNRDKANPSFENRHLLAYPVTNHGVDGWVEKKDGQYKTDRRGKLIQSERMANQIRFKVVRSDGRFYALVFHLPCDIPRELKQKLGNQAPSHAQQLRIWCAVHRVLDDRMQRLGGLA